MPDYACIQYSQEDLSLTSSIPAELSVSSV